MKTYPDIKQCKKLAEFLPLESANMIYYWFGNSELNDEWYELHLGTNKVNDKDIPCWSLAALLNYLREIDFFPEIDADELTVIISISYYNEDEARPLVPIHNINVKAESFIDACVELILKLHDLKLI